EREPIFIVFEIAFTRDISGRRNPNKQLGQFPLPQGGEGEREPIFIVFEIAFTRDISGRRNPNKQRGQFPLPLGEG
ncbi:hypothetical protein, partial [Pseudomonas sp. GM16]|uniref:hypothetical protein n=1 Tax=Pseudomonas sp. GM16 TaxID=1144322 RepID=UPI0005EAD84D